MITQKELKQWLYYSPTVGTFEWIKRGRGVQVNCLAGRVCPKSGYINVRLQRKTYRAHVLAWLYMTGSWPEMELDHKDGDKTNNAFCNLRLATKSQNRWNAQNFRTSSSGVKGVTYMPKAKKWRAVVGINNEKVNIGLFKTMEEAEQAVRIKREELHGEFANHGVHKYILEEMEGDVITS